MTFELAGPPRIIAMGEQHAAAVLTIYQAGIDEGNATFEMSAPSWSVFTAGMIAPLSRVAVDAAALRCTEQPASASSSRANGSPNTTAAGATLSSLNAEASRSDAPTARFGYHHTDRRHGPCFGTTVGAAFALALTTPSAV